MATPNDVNDTTPAAAPAIALDLFCPSCAYNLRGLTGSRCPECGESIDDLRDPVSRIPWVHRKKLGWWRAYWKTVHFVMFKQKHFANEMARPVSYRDAQLFRWVTVVGISIVAGLNCAILGFIRPEYTRLASGEPVGGWVWVVAPVLIAMFVAGATGIPGYLFHPRSMPIAAQNRAAALCGYGTAVLSALVVAAASSALGFLSTEAQWPLVSTGAFMAAVLLAVATLIVWWVELIRLARRLTRPARYNALRVALVTPLAWTAWFGACFVVVPFVAYCVAVTYLTTR